MENDTIVAQATAPGESAIAIVRMSGPRALAIASRRFRGKRSPERSGSHRILFGTFLGSDDSHLDTVLLSIFRAPRSYTGEDVVEISSHGGALIPGAVLEALIAAGARAARPGEFTERAYRNGKLDLAQAEAVAALVRSRSDRAARRRTAGSAARRRRSPTRTWSARSGPCSRPARSTARGIARYTSGYEPRTSGSGGSACCA